MAHHIMISALVVPLVAGILSPSWVVQTTGRGGWDGMLSVTVETTALEEARGTTDARDTLPDHEPPALAGESQVPSLAHPVWNRATPHPDRIILTWSGDPSTTQSVTWRTDTTVVRAWGQVAPATASPLFKGPAVLVEAETEVLDVRHVDRAGVKVHYHSATFEGLEPGSRYAYRVGDGEEWSEWFQFRTASRGEEPFSFLYFGDAQNDILSLWSRTVRAGYAEAPGARFMIHAGDLVNRAHSDQEWGEWFRAGGHILSMVPSLPVPGNHEYSGYTSKWGRPVERPLSVFWRPQFSLPHNGPPQVTPESSYFVDFQGLRVIVLNSSEDPREHVRWLEAVLSQSPARWTVAVHHYPLFSAARGRDNQEHRDAWRPIYGRYGVDLVLQGHDHAYARGQDPASIRNLPQGVSLRDGEIGTVYVVSVSGPKMYRNLRADWKETGAELERRGAGIQLFQTVEVDGEMLRYRSFTATGELFDAFDLIKGRDGRPNRLVDRAPDETPFEGGR